MGKRKRYIGLKFNYRINGKVMMDKYQTVEEFLEEALRKTNPNAPSGDTEIFNVRWNGYITKTNQYVNTLSELHRLLSESRKSLCRRAYERKETYEPDFVYEKIKDVLVGKKKSEDEVDFDGDLIHGGSGRYRTFFMKGMCCMNCGLEGKFFAKERAGDSKRYHLNLYGINSLGEEILMTKDHIHPKSKGGKSCLENYQTMCEICNVEKGNSVHSETR